MGNSPSTVSPGAEYTKTLLLDQFNGSFGALPDSNNWIVRTGTSYPGGGPAQWGTGEVETYTSSSSNILQTGNGQLWIIPQKSSSGQWTSARIETTSSSYQAPVGGKMKVEASIMTPNVTNANGLGYWPAFWALGAPFRSNVTDWPNCGEFDMLEAINGDSWTNQGLHCGTYPNGPCNEPSGLVARSTCSGSNCVGNFHRYGMVIDRSVSPETLSFFIDNQVTYTLTPNSVGATVWNNTVHQGIFLVLNLAIGGAFPQYDNGGNPTPTAATAAKMQMQIEYVGVWTT